jgi:hypothetical protein
VLRFSAVDYAADVWVNGAHAGRHEGGYTPLELDVGGSIHWGGTNVVTVRVFDPPDVADLPHGKQGRALECPELGGAIARATRFPPELCEWAMRLVQCLRDLFKPSLTVYSICSRRRERLHQR